MADEMRAGDMPLLVSVLLPRVENESRLTWEVGIVVSRVRLSTKMMHFMKEQVVPSHKPS